MSVQLSTGFVAAILGPSTFDGLFQDGVMELYSGPQPTTADLAPSGALLGRITRDGGAFTPGSPTNGLRFQRGGRYALKDPAHTWQLKGSGTGTVGWFRLLGNAADSGLNSTSAIRVDGAVGLEGAVTDTQLFLPTLALNPSTTIDITSWWFAFPPL